MNKKKLVVVIASIMMILTIAIGGTLAYFTAEDSAENVFALGNVNIELKEEFEQNSQLAPGLKINKDAWVKNTGSKDAFVRVHMAFPIEMDDGDPSFNASHNFLHWNFPADAYADGKWSFLPEYSTGNGYKGNGAGNWNYYTETIDGEEYAVYVATYRTALAANAETELALDQVYLDATVNAVANDDGTITYTDTHDNKVTLTAEEASNIKVLIWAEATQTETFENAYDALNTAFGVPGTYNPWAE